MGKFPSWGCWPDFNLSAKFGAFAEFLQLQKIQNFAVKQQWGWHWAVQGQEMCQCLRSCKEQGRLLRHQKNHHPPPSQGRAPCRGKAASASKVSAVGQGDGQGPISTCQPRRRSIAWCWSRSRREINKTLKRHYSGWANRNTQVSKQQIKVLQFPLSQKLTLTFSPGNFLVCRSCIFPFKKINK